MNYIRLIKFASLFFWFFDFIVFFWVFFLLNIADAFWQPYQRMFLRYDYQDALALGDNRCTVVPNNQDMKSDRHQERCRACRLTRSECRVARRNTCRYGRAERSAPRVTRRRVTRHHQRGASRLQQKNKKITKTFRLDCVIATHLTYAVRDTERISGWYRQC